MNEVTLTNKVNGTELRAILTGIRIVVLEKGYFQVSVKLQELISRKPFYRTEKHVAKNDVKAAINRMLEKDA